MDVARNFGPQLDQRDRLQERAVLTAGLEPERLELGGEILDGKVAAGLAGLAAFEQVVGEEAEVAGDLGRRDSGHGRALGGLRSGREEEGKGEDHGALCYPGSGPVATGRSGSSIQALNDPTYRRAGGRPACSMASASWQAVTPLPQDTIGRGPNFS